MACRARCGRYRCDPHPKPGAAASRRQLNNPRRPVRAADSAAAAAPRLAGVNCSIEKDRRGHIHHAKMLRGAGGAHDSADLDRSCAKFLRRTIHGQTDGCKIHQVTAHAMGHGCIHVRRFVSTLSLFSFHRSIVVVYFFGFCNPRRRPVANPNRCILIDANPRSLREPTQRSEEREGEACARQPPPPAAASV